LNIQPQRFSSHNLKIYISLDTNKRKTRGGVYMEYEEPELRDIEEFSRGCNTGECCGGKL